METFVLILLGFAGILLHVVMKFRDQITKFPKNGNSFKERLRKVWNVFDLLGNVVYAIFALIVVIVCVIARDKMESIGLPITELTILGIGYAADSFVKNIKTEKKQ